MAEAGGTEPGKPPPVASLERALDQVCDFLSRAEQTARVRALVIEARRLRNVVGNWRSIAPDPDVREEMIARVLRLANDAEDVVAAERASSAPDDGSADGAPKRELSSPEHRPLAIGLRLGPANAVGAAPAGASPHAATPSPHAPTASPPGAAMFLASLAGERGAHTAAAPRPPGGLPALPPAQGLDFPGAGPEMADIDLSATITSPGPMILADAPTVVTSSPMMPQDRSSGPPAQDFRPGDAVPRRGQAFGSTLVSPPSLMLDPSARPPSHEPPAQPKSMDRSLAGAFPSPPSLILDRVVQQPAVREVTVREVQPQPQPHPMDRSLTGAFPSPPSLVFDRVPPPQSPPPAEVRPQVRMEDAFESPPSLHVEQIRYSAEGPDSMGPGSEYGMPTQAGAINVRALPAPSATDRRLVMLSAPYTPPADAYRTLRRKLGTTSATTIALTSASPGEGQTACAINLAYALAETTRGRILLVEANMRSPELASMLQFEPPRCFSEQLQRHREDRLAPWIVVEQSAPASPAHPGEETTDSASEKSSPSGSRPSGAAFGAPGRLQGSSAPSPEHRPAKLSPVHVLAVNPQADRPPMLDAVAFSMGLESLKRAGYAYIIVVSPPVLGSMDMNVVSDAVQGVLFTSIVKKSTRKAIRQAIEQLRPAPVLGVVMLEP